MKTTRPTIANGKKRETDHSYTGPMPQPLPTPSVRVTFAPESS